MRKPISTLKNYTGHSLGACGAFELWSTIQMMAEGWFVDNLNLDAVDSRCADLDYICAEPRNITAEYCMSNNFAFGGISQLPIFHCEYSKVGQ